MFVFRLMILLMRSTSRRWTRWKKVITRFVLVLISTSEIRLRRRHLWEGVRRQAGAMITTLHTRSIIVHFCLVLANARSRRTRRVLQIISPSTSMNMLRQLDGRDGLNLMTTTLTKGNILAAFIACIIKISVVI